MAPTHPARRPSAGARRAGYGLAIVFSTALLIILNGSPGWQAIPFLTSDTAQVLWLVNLSLAAGIAANLVYLAYDPPWLKSLGDLATTGIGLTAAIRVWQVFPFDLSSGWSTAVRVLRGPDRYAGALAYRPHPAWRPHAHRALISRPGRAGKRPGRRRAD